jgi:phosphoribosyl-ATP pyrophosphohydrolase
MTREELGEMAIELILTAEMDERAEDGVITVDSDLLFQFLVVRSLAPKKEAV